jgi:hypothetical protein
MDKNNKYFCHVNIEGQKIFCHSDNFLERIDFNLLRPGDSVYLNIIEKSGKYYGENIAFSQDGYDKKLADNKTIKAIDRLNGMKYPLYTVWNNHSLSDYDAPEVFRKELLKYIDHSLKCMMDKELSIKFKKSLFFFLSALHKDMPIQIANTLVEYSSNASTLNKYSENLAVSVGDVNLPWQKKIFENILSFAQDYPDYVLDILAISLWRSETLVFEFTEDQIIKISKLLVYEMQKNYESLLNEKYAIISVAKKLELLLALLRIREKYTYLIPNDQMTKDFLRLVDMISKLLIVKHIPLKTRIKISVEKDNAFSNTPDLLYALRVYLSGETQDGNSIKILGINEN